VPDTALIVRDDPEIPELGDKLMTGIDAPLAPLFPSIWKEGFGKADGLLEVLDTVADVIVFVPFA
jgi:hypothetical protein